MYSVRLYKFVVVEMIEQYIESLLRVKHLRHVVCRCLRLDTLHLLAEYLENGLGFG